MAGRMSLMYMRNNRGPKTLPWVTPESTGRESDVASL